MIGQLRGRLTDKRPNQVLVDVSGVGYIVQVPLSTYASLGDLHTEVTLLIHTHVREDALSLYGFLSSREKHFFEMLLSASGVGPTLALKILSGMNVDELVPAIRASDLARLTKSPGVGRKTAERIVVELRDKLDLQRDLGVMGEELRARLNPESLVGWAEGKREMPGAIWHFAAILLALAFLGTFAWSVGSQIAAALGRSFELRVLRASNGRPCIADRAIVRKVN